MNLNKTILLATCCVAMLTFGQVTLNAMESEDEGVETLQVDSQITDDTQALLDGTREFDEGADFSGADLTELNLDGLSAQKADFTGCTFSRISLKNVSLPECTFNKALFEERTEISGDFTGSIFDDGTTFRQSVIEDTNLQETTVARVLFDRSIIRNSIIKDSNWNKVTLIDTLIIESSIEHTSFDNSHIELSNITLLTKAEHLSFKEATFKDNHIASTIFYDIDLSNALMTPGQGNSLIHDCELRKINVENLTLESVVFSKDIIWDYDLWWLNTYDSLRTFRDRTVGNSASIPIGIVPGVISGVIVGIFCPPAGVVVAAVVGGTATAVSSVGLQSSAVAYGSHRSEKHQADAKNYNCQNICNLKSVRRSQFSQVEGIDSKDIKFLRSLGATLDNKEVNAKEIMGEITDNIILGVGNSTNYVGGQLVAAGLVYARKNAFR